jgi:hypothetical protein
MITEEYAEFAPSVSVIVNGPGDPSIPIFLKQRPWEDDSMKKSSAVDRQTSVQHMSNTHEILGDVRHHKQPPPKSLAGLQQT